MDKKIKKVFTDLSISVNHTDSSSSLNVNYNNNGDGMFNVSVDDKLVTNSNINVSFKLRDIPTEDLPQLDPNQLDPSRLKTKEEIVTLANNFPNVAKVFKQYTLARYTSDELNNLLAEKFNSDEQQVFTDIANSYALSEDIKQFIDENLLDTEVDSKYLPPDLPVPPTTEQ